MPRSTTKTLTREIVVGQCPSCSGDLVATQGFKVGELTLGEGGSVNAASVDAGSVIDHDCRARTPRKRKQVDTGDAGYPAEGEAVGIEDEPAVESVTAAEKPKAGRKA